MSPLAELYSRNWQTRQSQDGLEQFLSRYPELNIADVVEVLLVDQALEWQHGSGPSVEQYLVHFPAVSDQPRSVLELLCGEMRAAHVRGQPVDIAKYVARFPDFHESLRRQGEVLHWLSADSEDAKSSD